MKKSCLIGTSDVVARDCKGPGSCRISGVTPKYMAANEYLVAIPSTSLHAERKVDRTMAVAKPIRALAFASFMICIFLFYQIYKIGVEPPKGPGDVVTSYDGGEDPMNERMCTATLDHCAVTNVIQLLENHQGC